LSADEEKVTKKQHYVPQLYLNAFAREGTLHVFDKRTGRSFPSSVRDAASQRFFYDVPQLDQATGVAQSLEKFFQPFEAAAGAAIGDLRGALGSGSLAAITPSQRQTISEFLAIQLLRTPEAREDSAQLIAKLQKSSFLEWLQQRHPELAGRADDFELIMTPELQALNQARQVLDPEIRTEIAGILRGHAWVILRNPFSVSYLTSDHPACNHGTLGDSYRSMQGLTSKGAEILFPISPDHLLLIVERTAFPDSGGLDGRLKTLESEQNVVYYNHWQVRHSFRFLYSRDADFELARSMIRESPALASSSGPRVAVRRLRE
jgi:hypothetical protein